MCKNQLQWRQFPPSSPLLFFHPKAWNFLGLNKRSSRDLSTYSYGETGLAIFKEITLICILIQQQWKCNNETAKVQLETPPSKGENLVHRKPNQNASEEINKVDELNYKKSKTDLTKGKSFSLACSKDHFCNTVIHSNSQCPGFASKIQMHTH